jgi:hypothetical protein
MQIFDLSKKFPVEERYSLTDQIRRSSRSVCANMAEAGGKRRYEAALINHPLRCWLFGQMMMLNLLKLTDELPIILDKQNSPKLFRKA